MKAFKFVIPIMLIVAWVSWLILDRNHTEVPESSRIWITVGAVILSGVVAYFLFPRNEEKKD